MWIEYSAFKAFKIFSGLKLHFNSDFDYIKYGPNLKRFTEEEYRRGAFFFDWLYQKYPNEHALVCGLAPLFFYCKIAHYSDVRPYLDDPTEDMLRFKRVLSAPPYWCEKELKRQLEKYQPPQLFSEKMITIDMPPECVIILDRAFGLLKNVRDSTNLSCKMYVSRLNKLAGFVNVSKEDLMQIRSSARKCIEQTLIR